MPKQISKALISVKCSHDLFSLVSLVSSLVPCLFIYQVEQNNALATYFPVLHSEVNAITKKDFQPINF